MKRGQVVAVALALLMASPAPSQPAAEPEGIPAEMLAPNEEARAFFENLESSPSPGNVLSDLPAEEAAPMDAFIRQMAAPGEIAPGWPAVGVDLDSIAAAQPGGAAGSMTSATNQFGVQRTYFSDPPIESLLPAGLLLVGEHGQPFAGTGVNIEMGNISPKLLLVTRVDYRRQGAMRCQRQSHTRIYSSPNVVASEMDMMAYLLTLRFAALMDDMDFCFGAEEREPGAYVMRSYDGTGRRLPVMDGAQPPFRFVPAEPFPALTPPP